MLLKGAPSYTLSVWRKESVCAMQWEFLRLVENVYTGFNVYTVDVLSHVAHKIIRYFKLIHIRFRLFSTYICFLLKFLLICRFSREHVHRRFYYYIFRQERILIKFRDLMYLNSDLILPARDDSYQLTMSAWIRSIRNSTRLKIS